MASASPTRHIIMGRFCLGQMQGGSSQFQYYPHLLALSKPQKIAGAQPITKSQSGDFVLTGGGVSEIEALRDPQLHPPVLIIKL